MTISVNTRAWKGFDADGFRDDLLNSRLCAPLVEFEHTIDALDVLCVQLTRDLFAIAKFLLFDGVGTDAYGYAC